MQHVKSVWGMWKMRLLNNYIFFFQLPFTNNYWNGLFQGYTPLHMAVQFGKDNIFELLCNVYSE